MAIVFLAGFAMFAVIDWMAVSKRWRSAEYVAKPATLVMLIGYAATGENVSPWLLTALLCSLLGDVYLMLPRGAFAAGLAAFLAAHVAYVIDLEAPATARLAWLAVTLVVTAPIALKVLRSVSQAALRPAIAVYMATIALMAASAFASGLVWAIVGSVLFVASDSLLAWNRFVRPVAHAQLGIMVTYHLGQLGLTAALR